MYSGNVQQNPQCVESSCVTKVFPIFPRFSPTIFYRDANSVLLQILAHLFTAVFYAQNPPVFEIVREESVKVYLHMYSGNLQQNPLCVESCFTKEYSISPGSRQRCLIPMKIQYSYKHTLCTAVDSINRTLFSNCFTAEFTERLPYSPAAGLVPPAIRLS